MKQDQYERSVNCILQDLLFSLTLDHLWVLIVWLCTNVIIHLIVYLLITFEEILISVLLNYSIIHNIAWLLDIFWQMSFYFTHVLNELNIYEGMITSCKCIWFCLFIKHEFSEWFQQHQTGSLVTAALTLWQINVLLDVEKPQSLHDIFVLMWKLF